jgi:putative peptide zinc metalloprotease protein
MAAPQKNSQESLADKLADVYTAGRTDLEVHRQIHDDQPVYILHDPQGFQSHRFSVADYRVFSALRDDIPLSQVLQNLIDAGMLTEENKDDFYRFVVALRMLNLLKHTDASSKELYEKYQRTDAASKQGGVMRLLSIKIPLVNPDAFLTRTIPLASIFFSRGFFALWVVCGLFALLTLLRRASDFAEPLNGVLSAGNIPYFLFSLIGLKVWHELGHGYACKHFGGRVPEMGTILMMGMPLAYVDASATWSFKRRYQRLIVMLGGMYFESMLAIGAVFVWASAGHSFLGSCAYQTILTASVVTVLFNANPLMRYDGYFVLVELLGLTNLRQLATTELKQWSKKLFLGIQPKADSGQKPWMRWSALLYGICSGVYSNMLAFGIAAVLAYKLPQFGIMIAAYYLYATFGKKLFALASYLRSSEETKEIKGRGRLVFGLAFVALPLIVAGFPAPTSNSVGGLLSAEHEERVRSKSKVCFRKC